MKEISGDNASSMMESSSWPVVPTNGILQMDDSASGASPTNNISIGRLMLRCRVVTFRQPSFHCGHRRHVCALDSQ